MILNVLAVHPFYKSAPPKDSTCTIEWIATESKPIHAYIEIMLSDTLISRLYFILKYEHNLMQCLKSLSVRTLNFNDLLET